MKLLSRKVKTKLQDFSLKFSLVHVYQLLDEMILYSSKKGVDSTGLE